VTWLPFSHDMGLVGTLLTSFVGNAPNIAGAGLLVAIRPETFARRPLNWLALCSSFGASYSGAPNFGLALVVRLAKRLPQLDLSALRCLVVGAEMVDPSVLRDFSAALCSSGLKETALSPAYGMAEAGLAVTMSSTHEVWHTTSIGA